ncbi:FAD-dependent oxidoreductase [Pseudomonas sp. WS 5532]|uniref:flavin monoamine oxidase family protein n=1 Tax=unclassified Pseudomonas TaxID=196821 RepID=UPI00147564D7|nr:MULTISPECIES: FAD-dependent oxidoreductase [unclassified Pseudomonas]NMX72739.1 FAD-dependent oxidoreductase [Pseudomonas sp. WS 5532]QXI56457.1 FAD-dependent oxidoreductase [Pseudomonas sp. OE 28.3]
MTIGSTYDYPAFAAKHLPTHDTSSWRGRFPSPPDLCFNYRKLVEQEFGIAKATQPDYKICIVGAGVTGLTAARELLRCGFTNVTLLEQSHRIGGRHLSVLNLGQSPLLGQTPFEMGAMRMPLFNQVGESPLDGQSLLAYYCKLFELRLSDFPNPGTPHVRSTGIYLREGLLEGQPEPQMLIWKNPQGHTPPPTEQLQQVYAKWRQFADQMTRQVAQSYGTPQWESLWSAIVTRYQKLSFRDLVTLASIAWKPSTPGDFGGLGMTPEESTLFYSIGIGDGSWGAFYDVCCLYPLRTAIFGFSSQLQLVHGRVGVNGNPAPSPYLGETTLKDCSDLTFEAPRYLGLAALDECLLFMETNVNGQSFYDHSRQRGAGFLTDSSVTRLTKLENGQIRVTYDWRASSATGKTERHEDFDAVIMTLPSWIIETHIQLENFNQAMLPYTVTNAYKTAHWETSCKVYAPLKKSFLSKNKKIPQIMVTDSFIHDVYTYRYHDTYPYDCILLSYTWEDDATKLAAFDDQTLIKKCITELDRILLRSANIKTPISPYIDTKNAVVQRWMTDKNALGCAKLYRAGTYYDAVSLMQYNRDYSPVSGLYLAGESFSVDAGWTEPCLRGAVDAVINLCHTTQAAFNGGFSLDDYPRYQGQSPIQQRPTF